MTDSESKRLERVITFFALTYAWTWIAWTPLVLTLASQGKLGQVGRPENPLEGIPIWVMVCWAIGGYGPTAAGLILTGRDGGWPAVKRLLKRLGDWRVGAWWYVVAFLGPAIFLLGGMGLYAAAGGSLPSPTLDRAGLLFLAFLFAIPFGPLGEELGWRGYVLPLLQRRHSALLSAMIIGVAWTFWHVPLFWAPAGTTLSGGAVTLWAVSKYLLAIVAASILMTWVFNNSRGSLLLAVAFHTAGNAGMVLFLFPRQDEAVVRTFDDLSLIPMWIAVVAVVALFGSARLSKKPLEGVLIADGET